MTDFYKILDVSADATTKDIKIAYMSKIRDFPPDQYPEEFRKIRQAYETLGNAKTRTEYDTLSVYGDEIHQLLDEGLGLLEEGYYRAAADNFKKIVFIEPTLHYARNYLALALSYAGDYQKAANQYQKILQSESDNAVYHYNYARTLFHLSCFDESIASFRKALECDPSQLDMMFDLIDVYAKLARFEEGRNLFRQFVSPTDEYDFYQYLYLSKWLKFEILADRPEEVLSVIQRMDAKLPAASSDRYELATQYGRLTYELCKAKEYKWASLIAERAAALDPDDDKISFLREHADTKQQVYSEYSLIKEDSEIHPAVKQYISLRLFGDGLAEDIFQNYKDESFENISTAVVINCDWMIQTCRRMIIHYPNIYDEFKQFLQECLKQSKQNQATLFPDI